MAGVLQGFFLIAVLVAVGWVIGRLGVLGDDATRVLTRTAFFVGVPALLFVTLSRADVAAVFSTVLVAVAVGSVGASLLYLPVGRWRRRPAAEVTVGSMAAGYVNAGNLGLPIAVFGLGSAAAVAPALVFQLGVLTPVFTTLLDVQTARARGEAPSLGRTLTAPLRNPLAIASALGLAVAVSGVELPALALAPVELLADLAVPAMLLAFGLSLVDARRPGRDEDPVALGTVVALKVVGAPLLALGVGLSLGLAGPELLAAVVMAALPTAQNVFGYAARYGAGSALARDAALVSTVLCVPVLLVVFALLG